MRFGRICAAALAWLVVAVPAAAAEPEHLPAGAKWSEKWIETADGARLHADVLLPKNLPRGAKAPVILSIGPYFNRSGQEGPYGLIAGAPWDPLGDPGPSDRFRDFVDGAKLMERGYAFVMVDLRGFGASSYCLDWVGPGEQEDVRAAVEWAAEQRWSSGRVGMYGKSYDGSTGLVGVGLQPKGLRAVVSQEPVYDMYRYLYANGVRYPNSLGTPALYGLIAAAPGPLLSPLPYQLGTVTNPSCLIGNLLAQQRNDHSSAYWRARDLIRLSRGSTVPLFLTQGFLEDNTKPDGSFEYFNAVKGPKRGWFGMWDHVRGNDEDDDGRLKMGRKGWFDEVMRFFDEHVRGIEGASSQDPPVVIQTSDGTWRGEADWPPSDATPLSVPLRPGSYYDDAAVFGTGPGAADAGVWTISPKLPHLVHLAGVPTAELRVDPAAAGANLVVDVYDVDPEGSAILVSRNTTLVPAGGVTPLELYGNDWLFKPGHRVAILLTSSNSEWWLHSATDKTVALRHGQVRLPFLRYTRPDKLAGTPALRLEQYREEAPFPIPAATLRDGESAGFPIPPALRARPVALTLAVSVRGRRLTISGADDARRRLRVTVTRKGKRRLVRSLRADAAGRYRVRIRVSRKARYRVTVSGGGERRTKVVAVRR